MLSLKPPVSQSVSQSVSQGGRVHAYLQTETEASESVYKVHPYGDGPGNVGLQYSRYRSLSSNLKCKNAIARESMLFREYLLFKSNLVGICVVLR